MSKRKADGDAQGQPAVDSKTKFAVHVRALNQQFAKWVQEQQEQCPLELWTDGVEDYLQYAKQLAEDFKDVIQAQEAKSAGAAEANGHQQQQQPEAAGEEPARKVQAAEVGPAEKQAPAAGLFAFSAVPAAAPGKPPLFGSTSSSSAAASQPAAPAPLFGLPSTGAAFGLGSAPASGATSTPSLTFGASSSPAASTTFGVGSSSAAADASSTPTFGVSSKPATEDGSAAAFGASSSAAAGAGSLPAFGSSTGFAFGATPAFGGFGASSTPAFGASSGPAPGTGAASGFSFGASSTPAFNFGGGTPAFNFGGPAAAAGGKAQEEEDEEEEEQEPAEPSVQLEPADGVEILAKHRIKLLTLGEDKKWKDRGAGTLTLRRATGPEGEGKMPYLVFTTDAGRVMVNAPLLKGMKPQSNPKTPANLIMFLANVAEGKEERGMNLFKCESPDAMKQLRAAIEEHL